MVDRLSDWEIQWSRDWERDLEIEEIAVRMAADWDGLRLTMRLRPLLGFDLD